MLIQKKGTCPKCGKSFPEMITVQAITFYCKNCKREHTLCPECKQKTNHCEYCGGKLLNAWDFMEHEFGHPIMF